MVRGACAIAMFGVSLSIAAAAAGQETPNPPPFKSAVERVALTAVVRDAKGKLVKDLTSRDFELVDSGRTRRLSSAEQATSTGLEA